MSEYYAQRVIGGLEPHEADVIARGLEDEIERRGLIKPYVRILVEASAPILVHDAWEDWGDDNYTALWSFLRATPEQRARAYLGAIKQASLVLPPRVGDAAHMVKAVLEDNKPTQEDLDRLTHE